MLTTNNFRTAIWALSFGNGNCAALCGLLDIPLDSKCILPAQEGDLYLQRSLLMLVRISFESPHFPKTPTVDSKVESLNYTIGLDAQAHYSFFKPQILQTSCLLKYYRSAINSLSSRAEGIRQKDGNTNGHTGKQPDH